MTEYEQSIIEQLENLLSNQSEQITALNNINNQLTEINNNLVSIKTYDCYTTILLVLALVIFIAYAMIIYTTDLDHRL